MSTTMPRYYSERSKRTGDTKWLIFDSKKTSKEKIAVVYDPTVTIKIVDALNHDA